MGSRLLALWYKMTLKKKLYLIIISVGFIMGVSIFINLKVAYIFINGARVIMDDNLACYKFQESLETERELFANLLANHTAENETFYQAACRETKAHLNELPYEYGQIGEERYGVTWNIKNGYETYEKQRDKVVSMGPKQKNYIKEQYKAYNMQKYLDIYATRLTKIVLMDGNDYYEVQISALQRMPYLLVAISVMAFLVLVVLLRFITGSVVTTLEQLATVSGKIEKNDFSSPDVHWGGTDEIGRLVSAFNKMKHATKDYVIATEEKRQMEETLYRHELERAELEKRFSMAQLQLIKSQLNPHFLFNTLNMMTRMAQMEEAPVTEEMLVAIGNLLRYSLRTSSAFEPLEQELKVVKDYMYIHQMRFGDRFRWEISCDRALYQEEVPVFMLQPLVENAVIHGISEKENGGSIHIKIKKNGDILWISVEDTGNGMSREKLASIRHAMETKGTGLGIGLGNIYRRISAYYEYGKVSIDSIEHKGTVVEIEFGRKKG
ncbi:sensor histidine kinase [Clostridium sp. HBUAS56010]|uniref:sensor histidine kinase n=1 Tax=Clostridium sp. HBUAS56010 TaxID=2571127 RepID=UPI001177D223|nr:sensor histidine kinase [Clostridium sp. HBUAS56010]